MRKQPDDGSRRSKKIVAKELNLTLTIIIISFLINIISVHLYNLVVNVKDEPIKNCHQF